MAFMQIKNNPFEDFGKRWDGLGNRSERAIGEAATAASETLVETIKERAGAYPAFSDDVLRQTQVLQDAEGRWRVGLPQDSPLNEEAMEAEYGEEDGGPQALMRTSENRAREKAAETFDEVLLRELGEVG